MPKASKAVPQDFVRFEQLGCHESENLYLTDEVLADVGTTWPSASARIAQRAAAFGSERVKLLAGAANWDRKTVDVKIAINQIVQVIDEKSVPWQTRVGQVIGHGKPTGQLADFLGESLVRVLYA